MNENLPAPTHTAWVLFVPVYMVFDICNQPDVWARYAWMEQLLNAALTLQNFLDNRFWFWRVRAIA